MNGKRLLDVVVSSLGLALSIPILLPVMLAVWWEDYHSPFYIAARVGNRGKAFRMVKIRTMVVNADKSGIDSTSSSDTRITATGRFVRAYKIDEIPQLWNVLKGDMSLVGPRPNVARDVALYTEIEKKLLLVRPGITDIASIVFSDEGWILGDSKDPDLDYNQLIRPWKSRLGLVYVEKADFLMDLRLIFLTLLSFVSRDKALARVSKLLADLGVEEQLQQVALRERELTPYPPPGATVVAQSRHQ